MEHEVLLNRLYLLSPAYYSDGPRLAGCWRVVLVQGNDSGDFAATKSFVTIFCNSQ
jgi:hypothetical protein